MIFESLARLADDLDSFQIPWALVGGLACNVYVGPRFTHDIDVAVALAADADQDRLVRDLKARGYRFYTAPIARIDVEGLFGVRLVPPGQPRPSGSDTEALTVIVDLLFKSCGIEPEIVADARVLELEPGLALPVASKGHLLAMKILAWRDKDLVDAKNLLRVADREDLATARESLRKMDRLGFDQPPRVARASMPQSLLERLEALIHEVEHGVE